MATSSSVPETVDLAGYAGDTLTRSITVGVPGFIAGREWSAQVRSAKDSTIIDATFDIVEPAADDGASPAYLTLTAETTAALVAGGVVTTRIDSATGRTVVQGVYTGVWDVQLAPPGGGDPTVTLCRGTVVITGDVTR